MTGVVARLSFVARDRRGGGSRSAAPAPTATDGLPVPPALLKVTLLSVFAPIVRFSAPPPLMSTSVVVAICWAFVFCVTVALLITRPAPTGPAGMTTLPAVVAVRFRVP